tara:strand:- start:45011 stop:46336 length:1326 start_codon:yes stop_codon:yes gene_type:complete
MSLYSDNRRRFQAILNEKGIAAVIPTNTVKVRNHDCDFRFRPDSDFWYLTGFAEPDSWLVLLPGEDGGKSILFLRDKDPLQETWQGRRLGIDAAPDALDVDEARNVDDLWDTLGELLADHTSLMWRTGNDEGRDRRMLEVVADLRRRARGGVQPPVELLDPAPILHELRLFKTEAEVELMRAAAAITTEAHTAAMATAAPGVNECEIDALIDYTFRRRGSTGQAYNNIVAGGANACILHYVENDAPLVDGELLLIDAGAEMDYYASDVTRTFPVNGRFSDAQRAVYEVVLRSQIAAVNAVAPGVPFLHIHEIALNELVDGLIELGVCQGTRASVIQDKSYSRFFMHKTSHWLGLDVHDCGTYTADGKPRKLEVGMVLTVEPGLYFDPSLDGVEPKYVGIGVRIEDDILVTPDGHENLTAAIPKTVDAVEAACADSALATAR